MLRTTLELLNIFFAGLLAGEEFIIRYGVRAAVAGLEQRAHIQLRQMLIRGMRVLVPSVFFLALSSGAAVTYLSFGIDIRSGLRCAGLFALLVFISVTLGGTVPINKAALEWNAAAPPENWRAQVARWERLDDVRTWMALAAFALFLAAIPQ